MNCRHFLCSAAAVALVSASLAADDTKYVQVRETTVRATPTPLGKTVGKIELGEKVNVIETQKSGDKETGWVKVDSQLRVKIQGWIRGESLDVKEIKVAAADGAPRSVSALETQMAGEGAAQGERKYVEKNQLRDKLAEVDRLEKSPLTRVTLDRIKAFLNRGQVVPREGN